MRSMERVLILGWPLKPQAWLDEYPSVEVARIYLENLGYLQKRSKTFSFHAPRFLRRFERFSPRYWLGEWKDRIKEFDFVILIDEVRGSDVFDFILEKNPNCRICVFYDSSIPAGSLKEPTNYSGYPIKFYSCDRKIVQDYGIEFMPYFYIFSPVGFSAYNTLETVAVERDVFFVGEEKGDRLERLEEITRVMKNMNLRYDFRLVGKRHDWYWRKRKHSLSPYLPYDVILRLVRSSRAILELISDGQTGITQRTYEALFFRKKLITNSAEVKSYEFYHEQNVFILGERSLDELGTFLESPVCPVEEGLQKYTFQGWLKRFDVEI